MRPASSEFHGTGKMKEGWKEMQTADMEMQAVILQLCKRF
jgi:hypothetical protein